MPNWTEPKRVVVDQLSDHDLIVAVNYYGSRITDEAFTPRLIDLARNATWRRQDGYGVEGYTPPQGWDWSGIRDSSDTAKKNMAHAIRTLLDFHKITEFELSEAIW